METSPHRRRVATETSASDGWMARLKASLPEPRRDDTASRESAEPRLQRAPKSH